MIIRGGIFNIAPFEGLSSTTRGLESYPLREQTRVINLLSGSSEAQHGTFDFIFTGLLL